MSTTDPLTTSDGWTLPALLARADIRVRRDHSVPDVRITALTDDSRAAEPGTCFVAVSGCACDGHDFAAAAVRRGAVAVIAERDLDLPGDATLVKVEDTRVALAKLAAAFHGLDGPLQANSPTHLSRRVIRAAPVRKRSAAKPSTLVHPLPDGRGSVQPNPSNNADRKTSGALADGRPRGLKHAAQVGASPRGLKHAARRGASIARGGEGARDEGGKPFALIGITGTNGKTTVAWLLRSILRAAGQTAALTGTIEYDLVDRREAAPLTTPGPVELCRHLSAARSAGARWAVLEVSSHALDQRRTDGLTLAAGVFTNLSGDHIDYHGSVDAYLAAKCRLFEQLRGDAVAIVNVDDPVCDRVLAACRVPSVTYGLESGDSDVTANIRGMDMHGAGMLLRGRTFELALRVPLIGRHNVANALAAAATAEALGISDTAIREGLTNLSGVPGRLQRVEENGASFTVLVDYAHTDAALDSVLGSLRPMTPGRLICVFGCGGDRDRTKRPRMAAAVGAWADAAYVTSDNPRTENPERIIDDVVPGFGSSSGCRVERDADRRSSIQAAIENAREGDTVLIAGKGHETYQLVGDQVLPLDDVQVARAALQARFGNLSQHGVRKGVVQCCEEPLPYGRGSVRCAPSDRQSESDVRAGGGAT